jgi:hypothetical protein
VDRELFSINPGVLQKILFEPSTYYSTGSASQGKYLGGANPKSPRAFSSQLAASRPFSLPDTILSTAFKLCGN